MHTQVHGELTVLIYADGEDWVVAIVMVCGYIGLWVYWFVGILVCGYIGLWVYWFEGILVCGFVGILVCSYGLLSW